MMVVLSSNREVRINACVADQRFKEMPRILGIETSDFLACKDGIKGEETSAADIDCNNCKRLVHGNAGFPEALDALFVAQRFLEGAAQRYAHIFHGVVVIHREVAARFYSEVEGAVFCKGVEHVVKERYACVDVCIA